MTFVKTLGRIRLFFWHPCTVCKGTLLTLTSKYPESSFFYHSGVSYQNLLSWYNNSLLSLIPSCFPYNCILKSSQGTWKALVRSCDPLPRSLQYLQMKMQNPSCGWQGFWPPASCLLSPLLSPHVLSLPPSFLAALSPWARFLKHAWPRCFDLWVSSLLECSSPDVHLAEPAFFLLVFTQISPSQWNLPFYL